MLCLIPLDYKLAVDGEVVLAIGDGTNHTSGRFEFSSQEIQILQLICIATVIIVILLVRRKYYAKR